MLTGAVTLSAAAAAATAMGRPLDSATWSFALAVLAPVLVSGTVLCVSYAGARAKGVSAAQAVMLATHRKGGLLSAIMFLFVAVWVSWLVRQLPSLNQFAMIALIGTAVAWLTALTLLPACLTLFARKPESGQAHWLDDALGDAASYHTRNAIDVVAMVVLAAAVFSIAFLPGMRFGERQTPSSPGALLETPDARGAVHIIVPQTEVAGLVERLMRLPEVGAIRTAEQFLPPDAAPKVAELHRLEAMAPFEPAPREPAEEDTLPQRFIELERELTAIASGPATSPELRDAALRLRRAVNLFANPQQPTPGRVEALEQALFGSLGTLSLTAQRLARLRQPGVEDLDPQLLRRFVSGEGNWRVEVMPRTGTGTLSFAAAMRRAVPAAVGRAHAGAGPQRDHSSRDAAGPGGSPRGGGDPGSRGPPQPDGLGPGDGAGLCLRDADGRRRRLPRHFHERRDAGRRKCRRRCADRLLHDRGRAFHPRPCR